MAKQILIDDDGYDEPFDPNADVDARDLGRKEVTEQHSKESEDGAKAKKREYAQPRRSKRHARGL